MLLEPGVIEGRIVNAILCSAAFFAGQRASRDQQRGSVKVPGFAGPARYSRRCPVHSSLQLLDGFSESLTCANDTGFVPHELLNFLNELFCVFIAGRSCRAGVGVRSFGVMAARHVAQLFAHGMSNSRAKDQALQQGIAGQPVGAVDTRARSFTCRVETGKTAMSM